MLAESLFLLHTPIMNQQGFTLIELMVAVIIVGLLAVMAIPEFNIYKARALDAVVQADVKSVIAGQEAYFVDNSQYASNVSDLPGIDALGNSTIANITNNGDTWSIQAYSAAGDSTFCYDNSVDNDIRSLSGTNASCS